MRSAADLAVQLNLGLVVETELVDRERRRCDLIAMSSHIIGPRKTLQTMGQLLFGEDIMQV